MADLGHQLCMRASGPWEGLNSTDVTQRTCHWPLGALRREQLAGRETQGEAPRLWGQCLPGALERWDRTWSHHCRVVLAEESLGARGVYVL